MRPARLQHVLDLFRRRNPAATIPITELRIIRRGRSVIIDYDGTIIDPVSGQIHLRFDADLAYAREHRLEIMPKLTGRSIDLICPACLEPTRWIRGKQ